MTLTRSNLILIRGNMVLRGAPVLRWQRRGRIFLLILFWATSVACTAHGVHGARVAGHARSPVIVPVLVDCRCYEFMTEAKLSRVMAEGNYHLWLLIGKYTHHVYSVRRFGRYQSRHLLQFDAVAR